MRRASSIHASKYLHPLTPVIEISSGLEKVSRISLASRRCTLGWVTSKKVKPIS